MIKIIHSDFEMQFSNAPDIADINDNDFLKRLLRKQISIWITSPLVGDTITATPTVREIKRRYRNHEIDVYTFHPEIFLHNASVSNVYKYDESLSGSLFYNKLVEFGYDKSFFTHNGPAYDTIDLSVSNMIDVPSYACLNKYLIPDNEKWLEIPVAEREMKSMIEKTRDLSLDFNNLVIIHPSMNTPTRTWPPEMWQELTDRLIYAGFQVAAMGSKYHAKLANNDYAIGMQSCPNGAINLIDRLTILESKCLLDKSFALITMDTGILHIGLATNIYIVAMFTIIHPYFRRAWRNGSFYHKFIVPKPSGNCFFCSFLHRDLLMNKSLAECPKSPLPSCLNSVKNVYSAFNKLTSIN